MGRLANRAAGTTSDSTATATKRNRFLHNNYSLVLTIISDNTQGKLAEEQKAHFDKLMRQVRG